jgi:hypothetical protein
LKIKPQVILSLDCYDAENGVVCFSDGHCMLWFNLYRWIICAGIFEKGGATSSGTCNW